MKNSFLKRFYPNKIVNNVNELNIEFYKSHNIEAVIFDIDNTLVTHTTAVPTEEILNYFEVLKNNGIKIAVVSNNKKVRVERFCKNLDVPYAYRAFKPRRKYLLKIIKQLSVEPKSVCLVGDQIFTDMFGANRMGFLSVLVTALGENETGFVAFKRIFEKLVLNGYQKDDKINR